MWLLHAGNLSNQKAEAAGSQVQGQPELQVSNQILNADEALSQKHWNKQAAVLTCRPLRGHT